MFAEKLSGNTMLASVLWLCFTVCSFFVNQTSMAQSASALLDPQLAAKVNGVPIQRLSLDVMARMAQLEDAKISRAVVLETMIANRLLVKALDAQMQEYDLRAQGKRVAFARDVQLEDQLSGQLRTVYGDEIEASIKALPGANLQTLLQEQGKLDAAQLDQVFGPRNTLLLDYNLNAEQLERAKQVLVLRSSLASMPRITLFDIFRRQNVQGRVEFFNRNLDFIRQQGMQYLASLYVLEWANKRFGSSAVLDLKQCLLEQTDVRALMALHGLGADVDAQSQLLNKLAQQVGKDEIQIYYAAHKDEFKRIAWVKARHIRLLDENKAKEVGQLAANGADFAALAQQYSVAPDASRGGDLGIIKHQGKLTWLAELAFMQDEGKVSPPFRSAVGPKEEASWEIVLVKKRQEGYQDVGSEAVRYQASRAIAQEKAVKQISSLRAQVLKNAKIEVNRAALDLPAGRAGSATSGRAK